jgi:Tfp pilus assembly protein PilP
MRLLVLLSSLLLLTACEQAISNRPCPRVTEFPAELQRRAVMELATAPALSRMLDAMSVDRAFNRAICL